MSKEDALKLAHEYVQSFGKTACVFHKLDRATSEPKDYTWGSAYDPPPKGGWKLDTFVSVTGLERKA